MEKKFLKLLPLPILIFISLTSLASPTVAQPGDIAKSWAEAAKNRNGKAQYQLMCPVLQKKYYKELTGLNWVTGVSSPQIASYKVLKLQMKQDRATYIIRYELATNNKKLGSVTDRIRILNGCIDHFILLSPAAERPE